MIVLHGLAGMSSDEMFIFELKLEFASKSTEGLVHFGIKIYEKWFINGYRKFSFSIVCVKSYPLLFKSFR